MNSQINWILKDSSSQTIEIGYLFASSLDDVVIDVCKAFEISERGAVADCLYIEIFSASHSQRLGTYYFESAEFYPSSWYDDHPSSAWI